MLGKLSREAEGGTDVEEVVILHDGFLRKLSAYCAFSQIPSVHASLTQLFSLVRACLGRRRSAVSSMDDTRWISLPVVD